MTPELREQLQTTLGGAYTIERELGGGGMSRVFVATESRLGRRVVVKVLRPEIAVATSSERFEREMALSARCQHPHIVPLLAAGEVGGLPYFTMPLVEGESLRDLLLRSGPLPLGEAVRLLTEVADALAYAHRQGVVHRDIKPENILLHDGHALIADFGVAKALHAATRAELPQATITDLGLIIGTPAYMSPEQAVGDPNVDHRADLYALGVMAFELITGRHPFGSTSPGAMVSAQLSQTPPPVARERRDTPPALSGLIGKLLAKDPADRPPTAEAVQIMLQQIGGALSDGGGRNKSRLLPAVIALGALLLAGTLWVLLSRRGAPAAPSAEAASPGVKSVAVLPFQNIGGDSTTNYFSQGIAEELISALGRLSGLRVASRTSAFAAGAASTDLREIGRRLEVGAVLEGTVQQSGQRVKVTARLVDVARDAQLWDGEYRSEIRDVFAVQDSIARAIAAALQLTLTRGEKSLVERGTSDTAAHDLYLRGRYLLAFRTPAAIRRAREAFSAAIERDSSYAHAWAGLADAYNLGVPFAAIPPSEALPQARAAAQRAIALESSLAEGHTSLGFIAMFIDRNWAEAERLFDRAVALNPSYVQGRLFRSWLYMLTGRRDQALDEIERARALDPLSLIIRTRIGTMLHFVGRDRDAIPAFRSALDIDSTFAFARAGLALSSAIAGRFQEAETLRPQVESMFGNYESGEWGAALALSGRTAEARRAMAELEAQRKGRYVAADAFALIHASLGETDAAFAEFERALREQAWSPVIGMIEPVYGPLRQDPRWARLMDRLNAPPAYRR